VAGYPRHRQQEGRTGLPIDPPPPRAYIIASSPRTGSSLLAEALIATKRAGNPDEFFDILPDNERHWADRYKIAPGADYVDHLIRASRTPNGVFGFKLHWHQIPALRRRLAESRPPAALPDERTVMDLLRARFPDLRFLWLYRRNRVAQAISYYRASQSKIWRVWNDDRAADRRPMKPLEYDRAGIEHYLRMVNKQEDGWRRFFTEHGIPALVLVYEDFIETYDDTVHSALNFLGLRSPGIALPGPALRQMADAESQAWEQRFRTDASPVAAASTKASGKPPPSAPPADSALPLTAYDVGSPVKSSLVTGGPNRAWMDSTPKRFAYRCLPMVIANQWGWMITTRQRVEAIWDGTQPIGGLAVACFGEGAAAAASHFGCGVLTFHIGYLFRTPPGFNLHIRGPANAPKDGICPLEGIVESDWIEATFTMNWKMTRPNHKVVFEPDEPIAMISPVRRGELERFVPEIVPIHRSRDLFQRYNEWSAARNSFNADLRNKESTAQTTGWQKDYTRGQTTRGEAAPDHQTSLRLNEFTFGEAPREK
jgi:LPS sulfotransferase NodH